MTNFEDASGYLKEFFNTYINNCDRYVKRKRDPDKDVRIATLEAQVTNLVETMDRHVMVLNRLMERLHETQIQVNALNKARHIHTYGKSFGDPIYGELHEDK